MKRIFLLAGAVGWGISILGVLLPWRTILMNLGAAGPVSDPQIQYWFRMAAGSWSMIGFLYLMAFLHPVKYRRMIPLLAIGTLLEGVVLLQSGAGLGLPLFPFIGDVGFCLTVGLGLFITLAVKERFLAGLGSYPLLAGRSANATVWKFDDVDPAITAAYLETIAFAFFLETKDLFKLRPEDSLFDLYDSYYKTGKRSFFRSGMDDCELEECLGGFEVLCKFSGTEFNHKEPLRDQVKTIASCRKNEPPNAEEIKSLKLTMHLLPLITR